MTKRAVLYARVSTDEQADKGYSLPSQIKSCREYAAKHGLEVVAILQEDCSGAIEFTERPQGKVLWEMLRRGEAHHVVFHCIDRIARPDLPSDFLITLRQLRRSGAYVHTCDMGELEDKPEKELIYYIMGWKAGDERKAIAERTMRGKLERVAKSLSEKRVDY